MLSDDPIPCQHCGEIWQFGDGHFQSCERRNEPIRQCDDPAHADSLAGGLMLVAAVVAITWLCV